MCLADAKKGERLKISSIKADKALKKRLASFGIIVNKEIVVNEISLGNNNIKISIGNSNVALRTEEAKYIFVIPKAA